jgi:hypothetical protein
MTQSSSILHYGLDFTASATRSATQLGSGYRYPELTYSGDPWL